MIWAIYRDGGAWRVEAPDMLTAVIRANKYTKAEKIDDVHYAKPVFVADVEAPRPGRSLSLFTRSLRVGVGGYLRVYRLELIQSAAVVEHVDYVSVDEALALALSWAQRLARLKLTPPKHIPVQIYRSGPREGELRFGAHHSQADRKRIISDIKHNARLEEQREHVSACLSHVVCVLTSLDATSELGADSVETAAKCNAVARVLAALPWSAHGKDWCDSRVAALKRQAAVWESIERYGLRPGSRCEVLRDANAGPNEDTAEGPATVLAVLPEDDDAYDTRRVVCADGREWDVPTSALRPISVPSA